MHEGHDLFIFLRRKGQLGTPSPDGYEHEHIPGHRPQGDRQVLYGRKIRLIMTSDRGIDLERKTCLAGKFEGQESFVEASPHLAKEIVDLGAGSVQAHGNSLDARIDHLFDDLGRHTGAAGGHDRTQSLLVRVGGDLKDVLSQQRISPGNDQDGPGEGCDLIDETKDLFPSQLVRMRLGLGCSPTMNAGESTGTRGLPGHQSRNRLLRRRRSVSIFQSTNV